MLVILNQDYSVLLLDLTLYVGYYKVMGIKRTKTNPSGLPMARVNIAIPMETKFKIERIASDQHKYIAVCYREAIQDYIKKYDKEEQQKTMQAIKKLKKDLNDELQGTSF